MNAEIENFKIGVQESRLAARDCGERGVMLSGYRVSIWGDEKVMELDGDDGV